MKAVRWVALLGAITALATPGLAQQYPDRPIHLIVPQTRDSGSVDAVARLLQAPLEKALGQSIAIDNRPGDNGITAAKTVATAPPDGYTLLLTAPTFSITAALHRKLPYDALRALQPVAIVGRSAQLVLVNPKLPAVSLLELVTLAKAHPGEINYSTPGSVSEAHLLFERWSAQAGIRLMRYHYFGSGTAMSAAIIGETQLTMIELGLALPQVEAKTLRALATTGKAREPQLPDVPTAAEAGYPDLQASQWIGLLANGGTPKAVVDRLNEALKRALEDKTLQAALAQEGYSAAGGTPEEFRALIETEIKQWKDIDRVSHIELK